MKFRSEHILVVLLVFVAGCSSNYKHRIQPEAGVCLSFDDRSIDEWFALRGYFQEHDVTCTFFITQFDSLTDNEIQKLRILQGDGHEIGSHGAMHVIGEYYIRDHSMMAYLDREVVASLTAMRAAGFYPTSFAYPYGAGTKEADRELLNYFSVLRSDVPVNEEKDLTSMEEIFYSFDGSRVVQSVGIDHVYDLSASMIEQAMMRAKEKKEVLLIHGHVPSDDRKTKYAFDIKLLQEIVTLAQKHHLRFYTITGMYFPERNPLSPTP